MTALSVYHPTAVWMKHLSRHVGADDVFSLFDMVKIIRSSSSSQMFPSCAAIGTKNNSHFLAKKSLFAVDGLFMLATLLTPPEAGLP
jgi:hypothetical protein